MRNLRMNPESLSMLFKYLSKNKFIKEIYFERSIDDGCMKDLGEMLSMNNCIEKISLGYRSKGNDITNHGLNILSNSLNGNKSLKRLSLSMNSAIGNESVPYVVDIVKKSRIESVITNDTSLTDTKDIKIYLAANKILNGGDYINLSSL